MIIHVVVMLIYSLVLYQVGIHVFKCVLLIIVQCVNLERPKNVKVVQFILILLPRLHVNHVLKDAINVLHLIPVILVVLVLYSEMENVTKKLAMLQTKSPFLT